MMTINAAENALLLRINLFKTSIASYTYLRTVTPLVLSIITKTYYLHY